MPSQYLNVITCNYNNKLKIFSEAASRGTHLLLVTDLEAGLVPDGAIIECPGGGEQEHDGDQGVQHHGEDQRDQVEQGDVHKEHRDVHFRGT